ncbi:substrate-binding domain-containing protein [Methylobacterium sp. J-030]|uniref:substrate-binding domain-containing protein n=1 Tax=Methylobacterium sp. J-030 TaxID=2836627 RepID=UPI001FBAF6FC|nr:substrate-binding domain-containing protein [Methylobacterium sp. J-030]MCJ2069098.1 substrate-binding domain-containing protein [Methylobacterium sp. J-030]
MRREWIATSAARSAKRPDGSRRRINVPLCRFSIAWIAAPNLVFGDCKIGLAELVLHPVITYPRNTNPYAQLRELLARSNLPPPRLYSSASLSTIVRMAVEGIGVGVIPAETVRAELADGRLRVVDTTVRLPDIDFTATYENMPDNRLAAAAAEIARNIAVDWCLRP